MVNHEYKQGSKRAPINTNINKGLENSLPISRLKTYQTLSQAFLKDTCLSSINCFTSLAIYTNVSGSSSVSSLAIFETAQTLSPSPTFIMRTPCVARPSCEIPEI